MKPAVKDKYDFILELLESRNLSPSQKERVMKLSANLMKENSTKVEEIMKRVERIETEIGPKNTESPTNKITLNHRPDFVSSFLKKFKENTSLKWTTHLWDEKKYSTISDFIEDINRDQSYKELFHCNMNLYNLISYFIFKPKQKLDEHGVPEYGWPKINELKIGWQFPNDLLINWCKENFDNMDGNQAYPFQFVLPPQFQPKSPIKGIMVTTFENVVDIFKTEIQFRDNYLYKELKKRQNRMTDYNFIGIENFKQLDFYTYTSGFLSSIDRILNEIRKNETEKDILFEYELQENSLIIKITHKNSYPTRDVYMNNISQFFGGGINDIASNVFSLCDFSVTSRFTDNNKKEVTGEISILNEGSKGEMIGNQVKIGYTPKFIENTYDVIGFTYLFKFKL